MAKFEIGDRVKFINQIGGGLVTKITDDFIFVQDETGFDLPMQPTELIRLADMKGAGKMFNDAEADKKTLPATQAKPLISALQPTPEDEIKQLRSQVASLKDQVSKLKKQLSNIQKQNSKQFVDNVLLQYEVSPGEAEVNLHVDMLCEEPEKLTAHEAFELQMRYFRTCLNHAILHHYKKVTFIHGVGRGILKEEIQKELKQYNGIHFFDAPMKKYGVGATEVFFGNNVNAL
ncbi:MAG: Smr/MutS family protein [Bacteroidales bacterium]|nr:Smr/MutS family protein [Bacteroidales bacterium]